MNTDKLLEEGRIAMLENKTLHAETLFRQAHEEDPQSIDATMGLAMIGAQLGKLEESRQLTDGALSSEPAHPLALMLKGIHCRINLQFTEAAEWLKKAIIADDTLALAYTELSGVQYKLGLFSESEANGSLAVQMNPENFKSHFVLGHALSKTHKGNEAIREIKESIRLNPSFLRGYLALGSMYSKGRTPELAETLYNEALAHHPQSEKLRKRLYRSYLAKKDYRGAQSQLEQIANNRPSGKAYLHLGKLLIINGNSDQAAEMFEKAAQSLPKSWQPHFYLGKIFEVAGEEKMAREKYEAAVKLNPRSYKPYTALGLIFLRHEMLAEAEEMFMKAAELDKSAPEPQLNLGFLAAKRGRVHQARNLLNELIENSKAGKANVEARRLLKTLSGSD